MPNLDIPTKLTQITAIQKTALRLNAALIRKMAAAAAPKPAKAAKPAAAGSPARRAERMGGLIEAHFGDSGHKKAIVHLIANLMDVEVDALKLKLDDDDTEDETDHPFSFAVGQAYIVEDAGSVGLVDFSDDRLVIVSRTEDDDAHVIYRQDDHVLNEDCYLSQDSDLRVATPAEIRAEMAAWKLIVGHEDLDDQLRRLGLS
jgi:hypothetical protein